MATFTLAPPSHIPRLPLLAPGSAEAEAFAKGEGSSLAPYRELFKQRLDFAALRVPNEDSGKAVRDEGVAPYIMRLLRIRPIHPCPASAAHRLVRLAVPSAALPAEPRAHIAAKGWEVVESFPLELGYEHWGADVVLAHLLPHGLPEGTPTAFTQVGHIAHLNLRDEYLPYRFIIGQALLDKNPQLRTAVNKLDSIDAQFRFFDMELVAGDEDYVTTASESDCSFTFDFRQVYWNSRLHAEHQRLVQSFAPYDVLSDVMAGVGPFALPAAKKGLWVLANDLNPASYESLVGNMKANKVEPRIRASCEDGRAFIRSSILRAWEEAFEGPPLRPEEDDAVKSATQLAKEKRAQRSSRPAASSSQAQAPAKTKRATIERLPPRRLVDHFVMNLPASALEFLDAYRGAYLPLRDAVGAEVLEAELDAREKEGKARWPMVHVHCFTKDLAGAHEDVCHRANAVLGLRGPSRLVPPPSAPDASPRAAHSLTVLSPDSARFTAESFDGLPPTPELSLTCVRAVAPTKDMYCLSFRLTREILFDGQ